MGGVVSDSNGVRTGRCASGRCVTPTSRALVISTALIWLSLVALSPLSSALEMGADEHFELHKAVLIQEGYEPYIDFWNDQPPLISVMVAGLFDLTERAAVYPRAIVLILNMSFTLGFLSLIRNDGGAGGKTRGGMIFVVLLLGAPEFLGASMTLMADPVKVPLCLLSYLFLEKGLSSQRPWLAGLGGFVFGMAVVIKFTAVLYLPALILVLVLDRWRKRTSGRWLQAALLFFLGGALWAGLFVLRLTFS